MTRSIRAPSKGAYSTSRVLGLEIILWLPVIFLGLWALHGFALFHALLRLELRAGSCRRIEASELSDGILEFLDARSTQLAALGFEPVGFMAFTNVDDPPNAPFRLAKCYVHTDTRTHAIVAENDEADTRETLSVTFSSIFEDGTTLMSLNKLALSLIVTPEHWEVIDARALTIEAAWSAHRARLERVREKQALSLDLDGIVESAQRQQAELLGAGKASAALLERSDTPGRFILGLRTAARFSIRMLRGRAAQMRLANKPSPPSNDPPMTLPIELEARAYLRLEAMLSYRAKRPVFGFILALTGVAFALSLADLFEPRTVLIVAFVVLFHELGHFSAMRLLGYADATIFFIPFFGGAVVGSKPRVSLTEELTILLAGPLPGVLLASLIHVTLRDRSPLASELAFTSLAINGLNLLPIFPLDGGKILDALLFARRPLFATLFRVGAAALFLGIGVTHSDPMTLSLGLIVGLLTSPASKVAKLEQIVSARPRTPEVGDPLKVVIDAMRGLGFGHAPRTLRFAIMRQVVQRLDRAPPSARATWGWLAAHGAALGLAVVTFLHAWPRGSLELGLPHRCDDDAIEALSSALHETAPRSDARVVMFTFALPSEAQARAAGRHLGIIDDEAPSGSREMPALPSELAELTDSWHAWRSEMLIFLSVRLRQDAQAKMIVEAFMRAGCVSLDFHVLPALSPSSPRAPHDLEPRRDTESGALE